MKNISIRPVIEGKVKGYALVSKLPISFLGTVDKETGTIIDKENPLYGHSLNNKIFIFPEGIGSTVGSYVIYSLKVNKVAPLALVVNYAETILIAGAILADIPLVDRPEIDITKIVKTNDLIEIDTEKKKIKILS